jgi:hypothetical protein
MLKKSSIQNEYYFGDLPGRLQYNIDILNYNLPNEDIITDGWRLITYNLSDIKFLGINHPYVRRLIPHTKKDISYIPLLIMIKEKDGEIWLKGALLNPLTKKIALLTSTNHKQNITRSGHRAIKSLEDSWFIGHYRMSAPITFWALLQSIYSIF